MKTWTILAALLAGTLAPSLASASDVSVGVGIHFPIVVERHDYEYYDRAPVYYEYHDPAPVVYYAPRPVYYRDRVVVHHHHHHHRPHHGHHRHGHHRDHHRGHHRHHRGHH